MPSEQCITFIIIHLTVVIVFYQQSILRVTHQIMLPPCLCVYIYVYALFIFCISCIHCQLL